MLPELIPVAVSLPSRERGLKSLTLDELRGMDGVAPFAGAWIEIDLEITGVENKPVAPFAGAWIEILKTLSNTQATLPSLPSRERGLK